MSWKFNPFTGNLDYFEETEVKRLSDTRILGEDISALKLVTAINDTEVVLADNDTYTNSKVLGMTLSGGITGAEVEVLLFGKAEDAFFTFALNEPLFLTTNGQFTTTPPTTDFSVNVGHSLGVGAIFIDIKEQIQL